MRERKEEGNKQGHTNNKAKQHITPNMYIHVHLHQCSFNTWRICTYPYSFNTWHNYIHAVLTPGVCTCMYMYIHPYNFNSWCKWEKGCSYNANPIISLNYGNKSHIIHNIRVHVHNIHIHVYINLQCTSLNLTEGDLIIRAADYRQNWLEIFYSSTSHVPISYVLRT